MERTICDCEVIHGDAVKRALAARPEEREIAALSALFKMIGDETRVRILCLLDAGELCVCDISSALNMTKSAVSHQLAALKQFGIVRSRREGREIFYRLDDEHVTALYELGLEHVRHKAEETTDSENAQKTDNRKLDAKRLTEALNMPELPVYIFDTLDSTSDECRRRLAAGERQCLVLAGTQTLGRGRSGRQFFSPEGGLYMSLAMPSGSDVTGLTCRAAVETAEAIETLAGVQCGIKWVNDLLLCGKKVCGILAEAVGNSVILGIGVNLTPAVLPRELEQIAGFLDCGNLREPLAAELTRRLLRPRERADFMAEYRRRCVMLGQELHCRVGSREFDALAVDIDTDGGLVVIGPEGRETLTFGEIRLK